MALSERHLHLRFLFSWLSPEFLLKSIHEAQALGKKDSDNVPGVNACLPSSDAYLYCAQPHLPNSSPEELQFRYELLRQELQDEQKRLGLAEPSIFTLPAALAQELLRTKGDDILCRQESILQWRSVSFELGQDLFTCALAAEQDVRRHAERVHFAWLPLLRTDEQALCALMQDGISENHFHLNGSTQNFPITWGFLMNHPGSILRFFQENPVFQYNLYARRHSGNLDNSLSWAERTYLAVWCRARLFRYCMGEEPPMLRPAENGQPANPWEWEWCLPLFENKPDKMRSLRNLIERLRKRYGTRFAQPNGTARVLDYAICPALAEHNGGVFRFLTGERYLLYKCFYMIYQGRFSRPETDLLYLYLLLKQRFRDEMIQTNDRTGFRNFANYQDRKDLFWSDMNEYLGEARRMAINAAEQEHIVSLEMRISPAMSYAALRRKISNDDWFVAFAQQEREKDPEHAEHRLLGEPPVSRRAPNRCTRREAEQTAQKYEAFYAVHFIKQPDTVPQQPKNLPCAVPQQPKNLLRAVPRNHAVRLKAEKQAKVLYAALQKDAYLRARIRAVDAATFEIGCRPETFGTEFRFLRESPPQTVQNIFSRGVFPQLQVTYHVGEDFLDLADGLRAIDEAIGFLNLQKGDRLGHALALGVAPKTHYAFKEHKIFLRRQDLLDNLVWLLCRGKQWGVAIPVKYQLELQETAERLLDELYGTKNLNKYFSSWQLRGDHPDLYRYAHGEDGPEAVKRAAEQAALYATVNDYSRYKLNRTDWQDSDLYQARTDKQVVQLLFQYHFDPSTRAKGNKATTFSIKPQYIETLQWMQNEMIRWIADAGIAVECNPTSNVLIGTFRDYDKHPILRFNNHRLTLPMNQQTSVQLRVSVNTDDKGVFDTSLEFEYALLMGSLQQRLDEQGERLLSDDKILEYLNHLRMMGNAMVFRRRTNLR